MYEIGNVKIKNQLILAPMAGVNCSAFRLLCKEYGAGLVTTQMFHCDSIPVLFEEDKKKLDNLLGISKDEHPVSIQLVGSNPENLKKSTLILNEYADIIDFNMGCPDKDILANKSGGFLSKHPEQIERLMKPIIENSKKPVTAKIRTGWNSDDITMLKQVKIVTKFAVEEKIQKQLTLVKDDKLRGIIKDHIISDVIDYNNKSHLMKQLVYTKLIFFQDLKEQYRAFAKEDKITVQEAYENGLNFYAKMRNGRLNPKEIKQVDYMMMR